MTLPLTFEPVGTLHVKIAPPLMVGAIQGRTRACVPITGGTLTSDRLGGVILPGGYDWAWLSEDGTAEVDARYLLELDDGSIATVINRGRCWPADETGQTFFGRSVPVFETGSAHYAWLNTKSFMCTFESRMTDGFVTLELFMTG